MNTSSAVNLQEKQLPKTSAPIDPFVQLLKTVLLYLGFSLFILAATRACILFFVADWQNTSSEDLYSLLITGLRFDLKISAIFVLLFALLPVLPLSLFNRWHWLGYWIRYSLLIILLLTAFLSFLDIGFYFYFGTEISNLLFGIIHDGIYAVMVSILSDWRLDVLILAAVVCCTLCAISFSRLTKHPNIGKTSAINKAIIWLITIALILICAMFGRGTLEKFPLSRRTTVINDTPIINSLSLNGPYHLYYAFKDLNEDRFSNLSTQNILQEAKLSSLVELKEAAGYSRANPLTKTTSDKGPKHNKPNVIFVLMEGWSSHIAQQHTSDNQVLGEFAEHANQDYFFSRFFSNKYGTNPTIEKILLNSPIGPIAQSTANNHSFSSSNLWPFKRQGYATQFLSGGNSYWRKHGQFWPRQGFDQYIGRASIEKHFDMRADNPWGVYDNYLFKYLQRQLTAKQPGVPMFSFVLTTNNHGPVMLPADYIAPPLDPQQYSNTSNLDKAQQALTGYHFQTNALGQFMTWLKQSEFADNTIVVATGDHILKGFVNYSARDQAYNRFAVATYLYLPPSYDQLKPSDQLLAGSHQDLFPTLFELALSRETYLGFGTSIMNKSADTAYGTIDQGGFIFKLGVSTDNRQYIPWLKDEISTLSTEHKLLATPQLKAIEQQRYKEILQKYILVEEVELANKP